MVVPFEAGEGVTLESPAGTVVELTGLSREDMNGLKGVIRSTSFATGRHTVAVEAASEPLDGDRCVRKKANIKPINMKLIKMPAWTGRGKGQLVDLQRQCQTPRAALARAVATGNYEVQWAAAGTTHFRSLKPGQTVAHLPLGAMTRILWPHGPDPALDRDFASWRVSAEMCQLQFEYYDPASLAIELHCVASQFNKDDFRISEGGLLYLMGEEHLWGSAALNFAAYGSCAPAPPPGSSVKNWDDTVFFRAVEQEMANVQSRLSAGQRGGSIAMQSRNQGVVIFMEQISSKTHPNFNPPLPWVTDADSFPSTEAEVPGWWHRASEPWDRVLRAMFEGGGQLESLPCMFHATKAGPDGFGCAAAPCYDYSKCSATVCPFRHDDWWVSRCRILRSRSEICECGKYAGDTPCVTCAVTCMCGGCTQTLGRIQCKACEAAGAAIPKNARLKAEVVSNQQSRYASLKSSDSSVVAGGHKSSSKGATAPTALEAGHHESSENMIDSMRGAIASMGASLQHSKDQCAGCGKVEGKMLKCAKCKNVMYCSRECQKKDWKAHKAHCGSLKRDRRHSKRTENVNELPVLSEASCIGSVVTMRMDTKIYVSCSQFTKGNTTPKELMSYAVDSIDDLPLPLQFLVSCGSMPDLDRVKRLLPGIGAGLPGSGGLPIEELLVPGVGYTCLDWAARRGNFEIAEFLCTDPRTRSVVTSPHGAPVGWACYTNHVELARMLVEHGADVAQTNRALYQRHPAYMAAENGVHCP